MTGAVDAIRALRPAKPAPGPPMSWTCCPECGHQFDLAADVPRLMLLESAAKLLHVKVARVRELIRRKLIPPTAVVRVGQHYRIKERELKAWVEGGGAGLDQAEAAPEKPRAEVNPIRGRGRPRRNLLPTG